MLARGDQVRLPHGRGVGVVIECSKDHEVKVFVGRRQVIGESRSFPVIDKYVECELLWTGKHFAKVARQVREELLDIRAASQRPALAVVTGA